MAGSKVLVYLLRRDLRATDNPILHHLASSSHGFTHLLPVFVLPPHQIEVSGFLAPGEKSPYPPAKSKVGKFWRCGPHRAKFLAQSVWDLKNTLELLNSGLVLRVGSYSDVLKHIVESFKSTEHSVGAVWMTEEPSAEEQQEQVAVSSVCSWNSIDFKLWRDEKYYIDDRDTGLKKAQDLPDVFTSYRKTQEPLRQRPRPSLPRPESDKLPPLPEPAWLPPQDQPFVMPDKYQEIEDRLLQPLENIMANPPAFPPKAKSAHPFKGGETSAWDRVRHLVKSGSMSDYKETRNGLVGLDFSTKLSGYLSHGCITARQVHEELVGLEDGTNSDYKDAKGYKEGENEGTKAVRFELLWRDYMRLCTMKFGAKLFRLSGFLGNRDYDKKWKTTYESEADLEQDPPPADIKAILDRFLEGRTGMGLIDASQRELYLTGYTSNRARQNVASFLAKHLSIDWRYGAEWYEMLLVDYDVSSNWSNWQYVAGVGNDPRGDARIFNPVKQAFDYDKKGEYVRTWVPEVKDFEKLENVFQAWTADKEDLKRHGLANEEMVTDPIKRIEFRVDRKPRGPRRPHRWRRSNGRGGRKPAWGSNEGDSSTGSAENAEAAGEQNSSERQQENHGRQNHNQHQHQTQRQDQHQQYQHQNQYQQHHQDFSQQEGYGAHQQPLVVRGSYENNYISQDGWTTRGRGGGWRGNGRGGGGRGNGFRSNYSTHNPPATQQYASPPPHMGPVV
ncbi:hypothetical protein G7046_g6134 [Stylonectria norvegica]|nr:hypothetical protein G7046_g6134 [Stylonectria norvegica]